MQYPAGSAPNHQQGQPTPPNTQPPAGIFVVMLGMFMSLISIGGAAGIATSSNTILWALVIPFLGIIFGGVVAIIGASAILQQAKTPTLPPGPQWAQMPPANQPQSLPYGAQPYGALPQQPQGRTCSKCLTVNEPGAQVCDTCGMQLPVANTQ